MNFLICIKFIDLSFVCLNDKWNIVFEVIIFKSVRKINEYTIQSTFQNIICSNIYMK